MGPFYCPDDERIYIDLYFFDTLQNRLGASGDFAQAYVIRMRLVTMSRIFSVFQIV